VSAVLLRGDARHLPLPDESVDLICTSPPYWSQRDYRDGGESLVGQIGSEETPQEYIAALVECTQEWMRVLKPEGSIFVVIGDKYANDAKWGGATSGKHVAGLHGKTGIGRARVRTGLPPKSLIGLPWWYAFECADQLGLTLRRDIIWSKTNGLPESVTDRCRTSHEYVFHFVRQARYFSAVDEIREPHEMKPQRRPNGHKSRQQLGILPAQTYSTSQRDEIGVDGHPLGKLPGSVWQIASAPLFVPEHIEHARCCGGRKQLGCEDGLDHHAAYPPALARQIVLGWSPSGVCTECGDGRYPVTAVERVQLRQRDQPSRARLNREPIHGMDRRAGTHVLNRSQITGYECGCPEPTAPARPSLILDPCMGTGTTLLVADVLGRAGIGIDLSADYCRLARWRTTDPGERAKALQVPKPPPVIDGQESLFEVGA
jgi:DNA modification methylase